MKAVIKSIVVVIVMLVVVVVGGAYLIAPVAKVERATAIEAPPEAVYAIISNMQRFNDWSPWADIDPATQFHVEGTPGAVGQKLTWSSANPQVGSGTQTIVELAGGNKVVTDIDFGDMGKAQATMTLSPAGPGTVVVWTFEAPADGIMERWVSLMFDKWIGADFQKGLARLKALAEKEKTFG